MNKITEDVFQILRDSTVEGNAVRLPPGQLDRQLYGRVNDVLTNMRGKWIRRKKVHEFPYPPEVFAELWDQMIATGVMPDKNPLDFFPTPQAVIDEMLESILGLGGNDPRILEPSAGCGSIADRLRVRFPNALLTLIEADDVNCKVLRNKGYAPVEGRFEDYEPEDKFDLVVMNPPFALKGDPLAYITHIRRAFSMLKPEGQLVTIAPRGLSFQNNQKVLNFIHWVCQYGDFSELPDKSFAESGTNVPTVLIWMRNISVEWRAKPHDGFCSYDNKALAMYASNDTDFAEFVTKNRRVTRDAWVRHLTDFAHSCARRGYEGFDFTRLNFDELIAYFIDDPAEVAMQAVADLPLFVGA